MKLPDIALYIGDFIDGFLDFMVAGTGAGITGIKESIQKCKGFDNLSKTLNDISPSKD
jgi:hypothetical protein